MSHTKNNLNLLQCYKKKHKTLSKYSEFIVDAEQEEVSFSLYNNEDKINRWMCMMSSNENINVTFLKILREIEKNIIENFEIFQRNINTIIENKFGSLINQNSVKVYTSTYVKEIKKKLDISLPIKNLEIFEHFNDNLENDTEKQNALRNLFYYLIDGAQGINHDIYTMMTAVTTKSVQICYSGVGKEKNGQKKKNFSKTNVYFCMQDVLIDKYKQSANNLKIITRVSRWLSQVINRTEKSDKSKHKRQSNNSISK